MHKPTVFVVAEDPSSESVVSVALVDMASVIVAGSSNLDVRSLKLNYELMLRFTGPATADGAREIFEAALQNSRPIELKVFRRSQNLWQRWKNRWAHFLLARIDPLVALRQINPR